MVSKPTNRCYILPANVMLCVPITQCGARWLDGMNIGLSSERTVIRVCRFETSISFTPVCLCLSEETLNAVGPFYLVSMPREVNISHMEMETKPDVDFPSQWS